MKRAASGPGRQSPTQDEAHGACDYSHCHWTPLVSLYEKIKNGGVKCLHQGSNPRPPQRKTESQATAPLKRFTTDYREKTAYVIPCIDTEPELTLATLNFGDVIVLRRRLRRLHNGGGFSCCTRLVAGTSRSGYMYSTTTETHQGGRRHTGDSRRRHDFKTSDAGGSDNFRRRFHRTQNDGDQLKTRGLKWAAPRRRGCPDPAKIRPKTAAFTGTRSRRRTVAGSEPHAHTRSLSPWKPVP